MSPGDINPTLCITDLGSPPFNVTAGMTHFFTLKTHDIYGNAGISSLSGTMATIMAHYVDSLAWVSPIGVPDLANWVQIYGQDIAGIAEDNLDGTFTCQVTVFRAGKFILHVQVNGLEVAGSPSSFL